MNPNDFDTTLPEWADHDGVAMLRDAKRILTRGEAERALSKLSDAAKFGTPAELEPHRAFLFGFALLVTADEDTGVATAIDHLAKAWREFPDFAALPALLGVALFRREDTKSAARSMHAALVSEDPDQSLASYRQLLTQLMELA